VSGGVGVSLCEDVGVCVGWLLRIMGRRKIGEHKGRWLSEELQCPPHRTNTPTHFNESPSEGCVPEKVYRKESGANLHIQFNQTLLLHYPVCI